MPCCSVMEPFRNAHVRHRGSSGGIRVREPTPRSPRGRRRTWQPRQQRQQRITSDRGCRAACGECRSSITRRHAAVTYRYAAVSLRHPLSRDSCPSQRLQDKHTYPFHARARARPLARARAHTHTQDTLVGSHTAFILTTCRPPARVHPHPEPHPRHRE